MPPIRVVNRVWPPSAEKNNDCVEAMKKMLCKQCNCFFQREFGFPLAPSTEESKKVNKAVNDYKKVSRILGR